MSKGKRLHPVAIFLLFLSALKELIIPLIAAFIFGRGAAWDFPFTTYFIIGGFIFLFLFGYLRWLTFTYTVTNEELKIKQGIFVKQERFIRKERIYSIDITAGLLQRIFQLVAVKIETAGGGNEPEVLLKAVTKKEASFIKKQLLKEIKYGEQQFVQVDELNVKNQLEYGQFQQSWKLSQKDLLMTALTSSGVGLAFMAILALFFQLESWIPEEWLVDTFGYLFHSNILFVFVIIFLILLFSWIISIVGTILKYGGFTIEKKGDELEITRGIIEKRQLTLSLNRITAIRVVESILRQPFGLAAVYVESAGGGSKDEQLSTVLFPIVAKKKLYNELAEIIPNYIFDSNVVALPTRARIRYILRITIPTIVITLAIYYFIPYGFFAFLLIPVAVFWGYLRYKAGGFSKNNEFLVISYRTFSKNLVIIPKRRIQALEISQSFMQKIRALFSFQVSILTSITGKSFHSIDVSTEQKEEVMSWYSYEQKNEAVRDQE